MKKVLQHLAGIPLIRILLEERDQALLSVLILFHSCVPVSRLLWDQGAPVLPAMGSATLHHPALPQGCFPQFCNCPVTGEHSKPRAECCSARESDRAKLGVPGTAAESCVQKRVNPEELWQHCSVHPRSQCS